MECYNARRKGKIKFPQNDSNATNNQHLRD